MSKKTIHTSRGFTLIEVLLYIGLYAILMGGAVVCAYTIFESSSHNQTKAMVEEEGNFLVGKIDWMLARAKTTVVAGDILSVTTFDGTTGALSVAAGKLYISSSTVPLNNSNTTVETIPGQPFFMRTIATSDGLNPERVAASFRLHTKTSDGFEFFQDFYTAKYLRK